MDDQRDTTTTMLMTNQDDDESVEGDAGPREGAVRERQDGKEC